jgi:phosphoribosylaminoimidazolecarboxamide formyltransferase/IMP cyclohydrolase
MARKAFARTGAYDSAIQAYFTSLLAEPAPLTLTAYATHPLRYGENPHQTAVYCAPEPDGTPFGGRLLQGKALSYNNLLDLDAAWRAALGFEEPAAVVVKHLSPCGLATARTAAEAVPAAIASDPVSAFGSVIAANRPVDAAFADNLGDLFVECLIAPDFTPQALEHFGRQKNLRLLQAPVESAPATNGAQPVEYRSVGGGLLRQEVDLGDPPDTAWQVVTERQPTEAEWRSLRFAWLAVQPVKSNAIVFAAGDGSLQATVGIGGGQPNRLDCVRIASERAGERAPGAVMASDAFFPFPDGLEAAAQAGVTAVIQPGGSIRDEQVIAAANAAGMAMVFTGVRHFRH